MQPFKMYQFAHYNGNNDKDFQVYGITNTEKNKGTVLLVPPPGSSPCDVPLAGKENQRGRLATKIKEEGYSVLTMIPPGKPNHFIAGEQSTFSFQEYARCIEAVLYRDVLKKSVTHIVTSSLGQIATILALRNDDHKHKKHRKIIIGAPIDSLQHVLDVQQKHFGGVAKEILIKQYALHNGLTLDSSIEQELQDNQLCNASITDLINNGYKNVAIYGNDNDVYYTGKDEIDIMKSYFFQDNDNNDQFHHSFSEENAQQALQLVSQLLNDTFVSRNILTPSEGFIRGFYKKQFMR